jgi:hypothetical protein
MIPFLYTILAATTLVSCYGHHSVEKGSAIPMTNNPQITRDQREWIPPATDPWWKVYETIKENIED